jgi:hypothetical protein
MIERAKINQKKTLFHFKVNLYRYSKDLNKEPLMRNALTWLVRLKRALELWEYLLKQL